MNISKKVKKMLVAGVAVTTLISVMPSSITNETAYAEVITELPPISLSDGRVTFTPLIPDHIVVGTDTTINIRVDWTPNIPDINVVGLRNKMDGDAIFISMGVPADYAVLSEGKVMNYINDRDGGYNVIPMVVRANSVGVATVTTEFGYSYSDSTGFDEMYQTITMTLNMVATPPAGDLSKEKEDAKNEIDSLPNLTLDEKNEYKDQIDNATDVPTINGIVDDAIAKDKAKAPNAPNALTDAKNDAKDQIDALPNLTQKEKDGFKAEVDAATTIPQVDAVVDKAIAANDAKTLAASKTKAKEIIDALPFLTQKEKDDYKAEVDAAKTIPAVNGIVDEAVALNDARALADAKTKGKATIDALPNLTQKEKDGFKAEVDAATTIPAVEEVVARAVAANTAKTGKTGVAGNTGAATGNAGGKSGKGGLPQTGEEVVTTSILAALGLSVLSVAGWFGLKKKRQ